MPHYSLSKSTKIISVAFVALLSIAQTNASDSLEETGNKPLNFSYVFDNIPSGTKKTIFKTLGFVTTSLFMQTNTAMLKHVTGYSIEEALQEKGFVHPPAYQSLAVCSDLGLKYYMQSSSWILTLSVNAVDGREKIKVINSDELPSYYLYGLVGGAVENIPQVYWRYFKKTNFQNAWFNKITDDQAIELGKNLEGSQIGQVMLWDSSLKWETRESLKKSHPSIN